MTLPYPFHKWKAIPTAPRALGAPFRGVVAIRYRCERCGREGTAKQIHEHISMRCRL